MKYPNLLEYVKAIQDAGANLDWLAHLSPVLDDHGEPYLMSGDSSVVFKMQDKSSGKYYALKCFTKAQKESADASSNIGSVKYLEKELLVQCQSKEEKYPVELMDLGDEESMSAFFAAYVGLSTNATDEELKEAITDEFGVKYSKDGRKLLKAPQKLDGTYSVKKGTKIICAGSFIYCESLRILVLPAGVTIIGNSAFWCCSSLGNLVLPDSVTSIGESTFWGCTSLNSLVIPDSVTCIGESAFVRCTSLFSLVLSDSVTSIGNDAFGGCTSLSSLVLPDSVTSIGDRAFSGCCSLGSLVLPNSLTRIGNSVFSGCSSLESLVIPGSVVNLKGNSFYQWDGELKCQSPYFIYEDNILFDKDKSKIIAFRDNDATSYVIPDNVTSIGEYAFGGCSSLLGLVIPDSVTRIGNSAFRDCSSLCSLVLPDGVTSIGNSAFEGCSSLSSIVIPNSVTSIGYSAFEGCNFPNDLKQELISRFGQKIFGYLW